MANFFTDNDDLGWYFEKGLDWDPLVRLTEHDFRAPGAHASTADAVGFYRDIATMIGEFAAEEVAPHSAEIDREGVVFDREHGEARFPARLNAIFKKMKELDLHGMCLPRELGGMNAPMLLYYFNAELLARADVSVMAHNGFHGGIAMAMLIFSVLEGSTEYDPATFAITKTRFGEAIAEIARGDAWGCMDITEPDAGSDMARLRATGELDADGNWVVTGQKIFITSGHGKWHFVIARTEKVENPDDPMSGLKGLSFFLVKAYEDRPDGTRVRFATLDRVEHKLGHHGSVTATLSFERTPALLVGKRGEGFQQMLVLMNNARLGVGFESIGLCEAAYRLARAYAAERPSMGKTIDKHEMIADYLDEMKTDLAGLRALAMHGAWHEEMAEKERLRFRFAPPETDVEKKQLERRVKALKAKARRVTPLLKYMAAEKAVEMSRRCIQLHGGNGYMKEYGAEKLLRDALVMPIYEGTSQIQALMAMKDTLGAIIKNPGDFVRRRAQAEWRSRSSRDALERRVSKLQALSLGVQQQLMMRTAADKLKTLPGRPMTEWPDAFLKNWDPKRDFSFAMLHAERLTKILADEAICELLLAQTRKDPARREVLERYLERAEPRCRFLADEIETTGDRLLAELSGNGAAREGRVG